MMCTVQQHGKHAQNNGRPLKTIQVTTWARVAHYNVNNTVEKDKKVQYQIKCPIQ